MRSLLLLLLSLCPVIAQERPVAVVTPETVHASITRGVDFLIKDQNANGSWGSPTRTKNLNIYAPVPGAHHAFRAGATGLALAGLLDSQDTRPETLASIEKAEAWMKLHMPKLRRATQQSTYNIWGHAYGLRAISRLYKRETDPSKKLEWRVIAKEQLELLNKYEDLTGGWGYLDHIDGFTTQSPSGLTTSFMTGTVLLAMHEARETFGFELNEKIIKSSIRSIVQQRTPDFVYVYSHNHRYRPRSSINRPAGSLARSQVCNAALRLFGDEAITDEVLETWADRFIEREGFLSIGRKRPIPHESHFAISGYFYYYGVFYFAEAVDLLPEGQQLEHAEKLARLLLHRQEKNGSWWDYPLYDYHEPYGTGYSLLALSWCKPLIAEQKQP